MPRPDYLLSFFGAAAAGQRLDPLDLFARLLVDGGVAEVDVPVQARVRVVLILISGRWVVSAGPFCVLALSILLLYNRPCQTMIRQDHL